MQKYQCIPCGYIYNPEEGDAMSGIDAGTSFEDLPDDWLCPICGVGKDQFEPLKEWSNHFQHFKYKINSFLNSILLKFLKRKNND